MRNLEVRSPIPAGTNGRDPSKMAMQTDFDCEITGAIRHRCVFEPLCIFGEEHLSLMFVAPWGNFTTWPIRSRGHVCTVGRMGGCRIAGAAKFPAALVRYILRIGGVYIPPPPTKGFFSPNHHTQTFSQPHPSSRCISFTIHLTNCYF